MLFKYKAINPDGTRIDGKIEGVNEDDAIGILQDRGLIIISIEVFKDKNLFSSGSGLKISLFNRKIKLKDIVVFSRQIATLFESGVSALRSFRLVASETENPELRKILNLIADDIQSGISISVAMNKYDNIFGQFYSNIIKAGEESGKLNQSFNYLADYLDRNFELNQKIKSASAYPIFVIITFIIVVLIIITFVIPQLANLFSGQNVELPLITQIIFLIGNTMRDYGIYLLIIFAAIFYYLYSFSKTNVGKDYFDHMKLKIPIFNIFLKKIFISRLSDNLNTMLSSGVSVVRSLEITSDVVDNVVFKDVISRVAIKVKNGKVLSQAFYEEEEIPNIVVQMIKIGEETGKLGFILNSLSLYYKREVETAIDTIMSLVQPTLIILLAGGVGFLLASILLPMYSILTTF